MIGRRIHPLSKNTYLLVTARLEKQLKYEYQVERELFFDSGAVLFRK